jgi:hypothetical protein
MILSQKLSYQAWKGFPTERGGQVIPRLSEKGSLTRQSGRYYIQMCHFSPLVGDIMRKWHIFSSHMGEIILPLEFSDSLNQHYMVAIAAMGITRRLRRGDATTIKVAS